MNATIIVGWKFVFAILATVVCGIFVSKMNPSVVEKVSIQVIDAVKDYAIVGNSNC